MKVEELIIYGKKYISSTEVKMLLATILGCNYLDLLNRLDEVVSEEQVNDFKNLIKLRKEEKPIQYILNEASFYYLDLYVNENVLIPRFETEELVENTLKLLKERFNKPKVLDLCCGSGAIGLAIKSQIDSIVDMSDISLYALDVARINRNKLGIDVKVIESDLFQNINDKYDCIISNPPYIKEDEVIEKNVFNNEPHIALYGGTEGLDFYERILSEIENYLNEKYLIALEIGASQKEDVINIINKYLKGVEIIAKKDLQDRDRMIFIIKE